ncbi:hypothetical protein [Delftia tsuruhatensis]|uniref:hypothetical protein n=1 Tax=Delftia tsuruhatensis TaxID=180282 RepID=UPI0030D2A999
MRTRAPSGKASRTDRKMLISASSSSSGSTYTPRRAAGWPGGLASAGSATSSATRFPSTTASVPRTPGNQRYRSTTSACVLWRGPKRSSCCVNRLAVSTERSMACAGRRRFGSSERRSIR